MNFWVMGNIIRFQPQVEPDCGTAVVEFLTFHLGGIDVTVSTMVVTEGCTAPGVA
jgi:hypothetical protein